MNLSGKKDDYIWKKNHQTTLTAFFQTHNYRQTVTRNLCSITSKIWYFGPKLLSLKTSVWDFEYFWSPLNDSFVFRGPKTYSRGILILLILIGVNFSTNTLNMTNGAIMGINYFSRNLKYYKNLYSKRDLVKL